MGGGASSQRRSTSCGISFHSDSNGGSCTPGISIAVTKDTTINASAIQPISSLPEPGLDQPNHRNEIHLPVTVQNHNNSSDAVGSEDSGAGSWLRPLLPASSLHENRELSASVQSDSSFLNSSARSPEELRRLQQEVYKKRSAGMSYNKIFNQIADKKRQESERMQVQESPKRDTDAQLPCHSELSALNVSRGFQAMSSDDSRDRPSPAPVVDVRESAPGEESMNCDVSENPRVTQEPNKIPPPRLSEEDSTHAPESMEKKLGAQVETQGSDAAQTSGESTDTSADDGSREDAAEEPPPALDSLWKPLRRLQIFDKGVDASRMQDLLKDDMNGEARAQNGSSALEEAGGRQARMGKEAMDIVIGALKKFFFLDDDDGGCSGEPDRGGSRNERCGFGASLAMLMRAMERKELLAGVLLMEQGEEGHHMFVVEEGRMEVVIDEEAVRVIGIGDRVGELALLYNAPRSASVRTLSPCVLWSIHREVFKAVQAMTASGNLIARSTHLYHVPWLRLLGTTDLSKLAASFWTAQYSDGSIIMREGEAVDRCFLVESGNVICSSQNDVSVEKDQGDATTNVEDLNLFSRLKIESGPRNDEDTGIRKCERIERFMMVARPGKRTLSPVSLNGRSFTGGINGVGASLQDCRPYWNETRGEVQFGKGCFLGIPVLLASAELEIDGLPGWETASSASRGGQDTAASEGDPAASHQAFSALSPVTMVAQGNVKLGHFDVAVFTKTVGPFNKVLGSMNKGRPTSSLRDIRARKSYWRQSSSSSPMGEARWALKSESPSAGNFERLAFLGQGSFGHVMMVRKKAGVMEGTLFALKSLSKRAVVEGRQVQHIKDEKGALELFNHPFVLKLYTTFQDTNRVYFVTEVLQGGELWSVLYEASSGFEGGLPPDHVRFYSAIVVEALAYMHSKGIAYRDLKPENLVVDELGYLRIIDMGFAKQIPFVRTVDGETQIHPRSHTMCGTPEYLAPEFIFNTGHDQSVDLWAFGVLVFEMVEARTPFVPAGRGLDIAQLFTNIACVKKRGISFPKNFDEHAGGEACRDMISRTLVFEPAKRLGNLADGMGDLKRHPMYVGLEWDCLVAKTLPAPWVPVEIPLRAEPGCIPGASDVYTGDQDFFAEF